MNYRLLIWSLFGISASSADFYNLDFGLPNLDKLRGVEVFPLPEKVNVGTASDLFPGWNIVIDGSQYFGDVAIGIKLPNIPVLSSLGYNYSVYYNPNLLSGPTGQTPRFAISQTGLIPSWASELIANGNTLIYANNALLTARRTGINFNEYAWDVSRYAGQEVKIEVRNYVGNSAGLLSFDIIGFSAPEPSEWALMLAGGCTLLWFGSRSRGGRSVADCAEVPNGSRIVAILSGTPICQTPSSSIR